MTRAALTKLLILVILAFIICLPEFFTLYRASKVNFFCLPYKPCERGKQLKRVGNGRIGKIERRVMCDPSQIPVRDEWEEVCAQENQRNTTDPLTDSKKGGGDLDQSWFMCESDSDMTQLQSNMSSSGLKIHFEVSVELQLRHAETLNLTLYGLSNFSSLHLHPHKEEEQKNNMDHDEGQWKAFYCCLPVPLSSRSANQSRCLLWFSNQTVLTSTAKDKPALKQTVKDEWRCALRVLWLTLLCIVLLTIVTTVLTITLWKRCTSNGETQTEVSNAGGVILPPFRPHSRAGLSPIQEVDIQADVETLLDDHVENCYTASTQTDEQTW